MKFAVFTEYGNNISQHNGRASYYPVVTVDNGQNAECELRKKLRHAPFLNQPHPEEQLDSTAWQRVVAYYGEETTNDILAYLRITTFGNLFGNIFDVLLSQMAGKPVTGCSVKSELGVILVGLVFGPFRAIVHLAQSLDSEDKGIKMEVCNVS